MTRPLRHPRNTPTLACLSAAAMLVAGCAQQTTTSSVSRQNVSPRVNDIYQNRSPEVVRYDRYTLVSTRPADSQRDPLNQMIDITMPPQLVRSVGDGFRYLLLESGYSLCPSSSSMFSELLGRPLPGVQRNIGPVRLSEALQIVAGPAWRLRVDDVNREICFVLRDEYRSFAPAASVALSTAPVKSAISTTPKTSGTPFTGSGAQTTTRMLKPGSQPLPVPTLMTPSPVATGSKPLVAGATTPVSANTSVSSAVIPMPSVAAQMLPLSGQPSPVKSSVIPAPAAKSTLAPTTALLPAPVAQSPKKEETTKLLSTPSKTIPATVSPVVSTPVVSPSLASEPKPIPVIIPVWKAEPGITLREFLTRQASTVECPYGGKWTVVWPVNVDYPISARLVIHGSFDALLERIFFLYGPGKVDTPLYGRANRSQCVVAVSDKPGEK
ncbi:putative Type IV pilus protein [Pectobacterium atrosepticum SCRI1043]|uniref:Type IV pilus protein n=2 Tax=Pectobacterium atrosepticum TaxID=29471 RepID=Q6D9T2_PECAS|nr:TcpQ domain-containing protein [Pectobacterium atrosepticum]GKV85810.1 pilus biogenesis protein PilL [Pectobacterium carotovorum subsp. carotovorum]AFH56827.1 PilL [Pectobacterium atrosepticum]AIA69869.1 pilus assembly protein [Pectobacterium atrosepticum]AIK12783.1 putative Type IV pilus protein PilL [Pectobacterium atrosepticum]ATY89366.1 pilus assembly protein [Pectobacterium atrosepticum]